MWPDHRTVDDNNRNTSDLFRGSCEASYHQAVGLGPDCDGMLRLNQSSLLCHDVAHHSQHLAHLCSFSHLVAVSYTHLTLPTILRV